MIVNLNRYRKERRRAEAVAQAKENRVRFGDSKEERAKELRKSERVTREIENKRLDRRQDDRSSSAGNHSISGLGDKRKPCAGERPGPTCRALSEGISGSRLSGKAL